MLCHHTIIEPLRYSLPPQRCYVGEVHEPVKVADSERSARAYDIDTVDISCPVTNLVHYEKELDRCIFKQNGASPEDIYNLENILFSMEYESFSSTALTDVLSSSVPILDRSMLQP